MILLGASDLMAAAGGSSGLCPRLIGSDGFFGIGRIFGLPFGGLLLLALAVGLALTVVTLWRGRPETDKTAGNVPGPRHGMAGADRGPLDDPNQG
ncbi:MAG: hypothetical protein AB7D57_13885 [Desulfovibrionaceae bacterium]